MSKRILEDSNDTRPSKKVKPPNHQQPPSISSAQQLRKVLAFHQDSIQDLLSGIHTSLIILNNF